MADWFVSSASYAAITAFVPSAAYSIGNIVKPTAPALKAQWVFRCTTAGTASTEPAWPTTNNATITTGGATFTNVTAQSTYGWSAAAGDLPTLLGAVGTQRVAGGDRVFISSDHTETQTASTNYGAGVGTASYNVAQFLSVSRAGSTPPVAADLTVGAAIIQGGAAVSLTFNTAFPCYHYGINYSYTGSGATSISFAIAGQKSHYFDTCQLYLNTVTATCRITASGPVNLVMRNSTVRFGNVAQAISGGSTGFDLTWLDTPSAVAGATIPSVLFRPSGSVPALITCRGVDLSAITGTLYQNNAAGDAGSKLLFDSCRIAAGVTRAGTGAAVADTMQVLELVNCYDGTNIVSESYQPAGAITTESTIVLAGGAQDNVGLFSHKMVSNANVDKYANTLTGFWMDANYATTGSSKTATVEIISSASLNNDEISLLLEYEGTASSSVASFASSMPATVLTAASAVTSSTATWNSSPATPVRQRLQVTFTPRTAGRLRAQVRLGKASATVWYNPQVTVT